MVRVENELYDFDPFDTGYTGMPLEELKKILQATA